MIATGQTQSRQHSTQLLGALYSFTFCDTAPRTCIFDSVTQRLTGPPPKLEEKLLVGLQKRPLESLYKPSESRNMGPLFDKQQINTHPRATAQSFFKPSSFRLLNHSDHPSTKPINQNACQNHHHLRSRHRRLCRRCQAHWR